MQQRRLSADGRLSRILCRKRTAGIIRTALWKTAAIYHAGWISAYRLRESHADDQYCTAEVAIALLDLAGDQAAAKSLGAHFSLFRERYLAGKANHQRSVTAKEPENV